MKNLLVHGVYLSLLLGVIFYFNRKLKADEVVFKESDLVFEEIDKIFDKQSHTFLKEIRRNLDADYRYKLCYDEAKNSNVLANNFKNKIENISKQKAISKAESDSLRIRLQDFYKKINDSIEQDDREIFDTKSLVPQLLKSDRFWQILHDTSSRSKHQLNVIKNVVNFENIIILNYWLDKSTRFFLHTDGFRVAIAPKKVSLIEGESMEAKIYLAQFAITNSDVLSITANSKTQITDEGVAIFKEEKPSIGTHTISATASIKNPFTGEIQTVKGEMEYEVLPKCSRDCAGKQ